MFLSESFKSVEIIRFNKWMKPSGTLCSCAKRRPCSAEEEKHTFKCDRESIW